jgi:hypothetical protein
MLLLENSILSRISNMEDLLLESVPDHSLLLAFDSKWTSLQKDVNQAIADNILSPSTVAVIRATAERVSLMASSFLEVESLAQSLGSCMFEETSAILHHAGLYDNKDSHHLTPPYPSTTTDTIEPASSDSLPPYIASAYKWLLKNIHNPYPTEETKTALSLKTGASRDTLDDWFIRARKKMGWNALCKKHHAKSRKETLDAAYRFFIMPDPKRPLGGDLEYDFAAVLNAAKDMYSEKLLKSALAVKLDVVVKDMTPLDRGRREEERQMRQQQAKDQARAASSYPSPDRSPGHSSDRSLPSASTDENDYDISPPEPVAGRKRRSSSSDSSYEVSAGRPNKRHRYISICYFACLCADLFMTDLILLHLMGAILSLASRLPRRLQMNPSMFNHYLLRPSPRLLPPLLQRQSLHQ